MNFLDYVISGLAVGLGGDEHRSPLFAYDLPRSADHVQRSGKTVTFRTVTPMTPLLSHTDRSTEQSETVHETT